MDSFEWNKIAGAVLFALLLAVGLRIVTETLFTRGAPETPGYIIAVAEEGEGGEGAAEREPISVLLASADAGAGEAAARKCVACHTFGEGEPNRIGPNLWGVVMAPISAHEGYDYSEPLHAYAEANGEWDFEHLDAFLLDPTRVVPGTKMAFPGLPNDAERANVIAYLRTLAADPVPLPEPEAAAEDQAAEAGQEEEAAEEPAAAAEAAEEPAAEDAAAVPEAEEAPAAEAEDAAAAEQAEQPAAQQESAEAGETQAAAPEEETAEAEEPAQEQQVAQAEQADAEMPAGDAAAGETFARRCIACHSFDAGGANKVGPALFGVFNRPVAAVPDYEYSDAMVAFSEGGAKVWDAEALDTYLGDPQGVVPGTKMVFPPVRSEGDRANLIAYLATLHE